MIRTLIPWLVFAFFSFYLVGINFSARLGMIDDHEIAHFLGQDGQISLTEIPTVIMSTELGKWGEYLRFRPSYYSLRVLEATLWQDNAQMWYGSRYVLLIVSMWLIWRIVSTYYPQIISYLFVFYIFTMPYWPDIWTRLGPSEAYAVPALLLFAYGMIKNNIWMVAIGYLICIGAKENFLVLFPILAVWSVCLSRAKKLTHQTTIVVILLTLSTAYIATGILVATQRAGADIYGSEISYRYRVTQFFLDIPKIIDNRHALPAMLIMAFTTALCLWLIHRGQQVYLQKSRIPAYLIAMGLFLLVISFQYIFYVDQLPSNTRYDFPALFLFPLLDLLALKILLEWTSRLKYARWMRLVVLAAIAIICVTFIWRRGYTLLHAQAAKNASITQAFDRELEKATVVMRQHPQAPIVFVSQRFIDFEAIVSVSRYLNARGLPNEFQLYFTPDSKLSDPLGKHLQDRLIAATHGAKDVEDLFDRLSVYTNPSENCYSIIFGGATPLPGCPAIASF